MYDYFSDATDPPTTDGFLAAAQQYGAVLAGGDTCASPGPLMLSVTVQGEVARGKAVRRAGARVGDALYVSGTLGDSALALSLLQRGAAVDPLLLERHHTPQARVRLGCQLAEQQLATAMLDVSDGLLADLGHILEESSLGAEIMLDSLPLSSPFQERLQLAPELIDLALAGGEDYELLFSSARQDLAELPELSPAVTRIGTICAEGGIRILRADQSRYQCSRGGFDHFS